MTSFSQYCRFGLSVVLSASLSLASPMSWAERAASRPAAAPVQIAKPAAPTSAKSTAQSAGPAVKASCPKALQEMVGEQDQAKFLGALKSRYQSCRNRLIFDKEKNIFPTGEALSASLSKDVFPHWDKQSQSLGLACVSGRAQLDKDYVSRAFYIQERFKQAQLDNVVGMASLGQLLGDKGWMNLVGCSNSTDPAIKQKCQELTKCQSQTTIKDLVQKQRKIHAEVKPLAEEVKKLKLEVNRIQSPEVKKANLQRLVNLETYIKLRYDEIPWIEGKDYTRKINTCHFGGKTCTDQHLEDAIRAQFAHNFQGLKQNFTNIKNAQNCLTPNAPQTCSGEQLEEVLAKTPAAKDYAREVKSSRQTKTALDYLEYQQCLREGKEDQTQTNDILQMSALNGALAVATLGVGSATMGALLAVRRGKMLESTAQSFITAYKTTNLAADVIGFADGAKSAYLECNKKESTQLVGGASANCSAENVKKIQQVEDNRNNCLFAALVTGVPAALIPINARGVGKTAEEIAKNRKVLAAEQRVAKAEEVMGRDFKKLSIKDWKQKRAIEEAHEVGISEGRGYHTFTNRDLRDKAKILRDKGFSMAEIDALMRAKVVGQETDPKLLMQKLLPILEREPKVAGKLNVEGSEIGTFKAFMSSTSSPEFDKEVLKLLTEHPQHRDKIWALLPEGTRKYITEHTKTSPVAAHASNGKTLDSYGKTEPQPKSKGNQSPGIANSDTPAPAPRPWSAQLADDVVEFIQHNLNTGQTPLKSTGNREFTNSKNQSMKESKIYTDIHRYKEEPEFWEVIDKHPDVAKALQKIRSEMKGYEDSLGKRSADKIIEFVDMHHSLPEFTGKREGTGVSENYLAALLYRLDNNPNFNKRIATHQRTAELVELGRKEVKGQRALEAAKEIVVMINTENPTAIQNLGTLQHIYYHNRRDPEFMKIINSDPASKKFFEEQSIKSVQSKSALDSSTETKSRKTFHETGILRSTRVGEDVVRFIEQNPDPVNPIPKQHGKRTYRNAQGDEKTEKQLAKEIGYFTEHNEFWDPIASHPQASKIMAEVKSGVTGKLGRNLGQDLIDFVKQENRLPSGSGNGEWNGISETSFRRKISLQQKNPYFLEKVNSHKRTKELMDKYFEDQKRLFPNSVVAHSNQTRAQTKASDLALGAPPYVTQSQELSNTQQLLPTTKHSDVQTPQAPKQTAQTSQVKAADLAHQPPKAAEIAHQDPPQAALVPQPPKAPQPRVQATERQSGASPTMKSATDQKPPVKTLYSDPAQLNFSQQRAEALFKYWQLTGEDADVLASISNRSATQLKASQFFDELKFNSISSQIPRNERAEAREAYETLMKRISEEKVKQAKIVAARLKELKAPSTTAFDVEPRDIPNAKATIVYPRGEQPPADPLHARLDQKHFEDPLELKPFTRPPVPDTDVPKFWQDPGGKFKTKAEVLQAHQSNVAAYLHENPSAATLYPKDKILNKQEQRAEDVYQNWLKTGERGRSYNSAVTKESQKAQDALRRLTRDAQAQYDYDNPGSAAAQNKGAIAAFKALDERITQIRSSKFDGPAEMAGKVKGDRAQVPDANKFLAPRTSDISKANSTSEGWLARMTGNPIKTENPIKHEVADFNHEFSTPADRLAMKNKIIAEAMKSPELRKDVFNPKGFLKDQPENFRLAIQTELKKIYRKADLKETTSGKSAFDASKAKKAPSQFDQPGETVPQAIQSKNGLVKLEPPIETEQVANQGPSYRRSEANPQVKGKYASPSGKAQVVPPRTITNDEIENSIAKFGKMELQERIDFQNRIIKDARAHPSLRQEIEDGDGLFANAPKGFLEALRNKLSIEAEQKSVPLSHAAQNKMEPPLLKVGAKERIPFEVQSGPPRVDPESLDSFVGPAHPLVGPTQSRTIKTDETIPQVSHKSSGAVKLENVETVAGKEQRATSIAQSAQKTQLASHTQQFSLSANKLADDIFNRAEELSYNLNEEALSKDGLIRIKEVLSKIQNKSIDRLLDNHDQAGAQRSYAIYSKALDRIEDLNKRAGTSNPPLLKKVINQVEEDLSTLPSTQRQLDEVIEQASHVTQTPTKTSKTRATDTLNINYRNKKAVADLVATPAVKLSALESYKDLSQNVVYQTIKDKTKGDILGNQLSVVLTGQVMKEFKSLDVNYKERVLKSLQKGFSESNGVEYLKNANGNKAKTFAIQIEVDKRRIYGCMNEDKFPNVIFFIKYHSEHGTNQQIKEWIDKHPLCN